MSFKNKVINSVFCIFLLFFAQNAVFAIDEETIENKPVEAKVSKDVVLNLDDCIKIALRNSPQIEISENEILLYKARLGQAKADYSPTLGLNNGYSHTKHSLIDELVLANLSVNQLIYNFGKTSSKIKVQKFNLKSADFGLENVILQTIYNVKNAYYGVLFAKVEQDIKLRNAQLAERHYEMAKGFYDVGMKSYIDVTNAEVTYNNAKIEYVQAMTNYRNAIIALNNSMYLVDSAKYSVSDTEDFNMPKGLSEKEAEQVYQKYVFPEKSHVSQNIDESAQTKTEQGSSSSLVLKSGLVKHNMLENFKFTPYNIEMDEAIKTAYENRPDLKALLAKEKSAKESLRLAKKEYFPDLNASLSTGFMGDNFPVHHTLRLGASLNIPTVNPMLTKYKIDESKVNLSTALANITLQKQNIFFDVQKAHTNLKEIERRIPLLDATVKQAFQNFELADGRYEVGLGNYIELQDAQTDYNNAQLAYAQAVYDYNMARIYLEYSMGVK